MALLACTCPSCGGKLEFNDDKEAMFCTFCGTKVLREQIVTVTIFDTDNNKPADWFYDNVVELLLKGRERDADKVLEEFFKDYPADDRIVELREFYNTYPCFIAEKGNDEDAYTFIYKEKQTTIRYNENGFVYDGKNNSVKEEIDARRKEISDAEELFEYAKATVETFPDRIKEAYSLTIAKYEDILEKYKENIGNISNEMIISSQTAYRKKIKMEKSEEAKNSLIFVIVCVVFVLGILGFCCCGFFLI